jgi:hypothetical protein
MITYLKNHKDQPNKYPPDLNLKENQKNYLQTLSNLNQNKKTKSIKKHLHKINQTIIIIKHNNL